MTDTRSGLDLTTFLVSSIHDMKNSVSVMTGYMQHALQQTDNTEGELYQQTTLALYEAQRISDHLIQLLALYKINGDFYPFDARDHFMDEFGQDVIDRISPLAGFRQIEVVLDSQPSLWWWFDYDLVFGAVIQAMHNALRYSCSRVRLGIHSQAGMLEIRVEDDGPGFPDELLAAERTPLGSVSFESGSTRLGLYFSAVIASLHRNQGQSGQTRLENGGQLGGGCFILRLP